jgi:hypothetical protein
MSKYALKLEQLVQTDKYGDILVTIQYDGNGPKLVSVNGESLEGELKHNVDTVLGLINFNLAKGITPVELAEQLEIEPQDGMHTSLNDLLMVVGTSLRDAPAGIETIDPSILLEIAPEMIRDFTENAVAMITGDMDAQPVNIPTTPASEGSYDQSEPASTSQDASQDQSEKPATEEGDSKGGFFGGFSNRHGGK